MSLEQQDAAAAAVAKTPNRVTLQHLKDQVAGYVTYTAGDAARALGLPASAAQDVFTICVLTTKNGFTVLGTSAPADPGNFNAELGGKIAFDNALEQLWLLEGYLLRARLHAQTAYQTPVQEPIHY
jgi:hypothetical protein